MPLEEVLGMTWKEKLRALEPCPEAYRWACQYTTLRQAWRACERGEWMRWLLVSCGGLFNDEIYDCVALTEREPWRGMASGENSLQNAYIILDFMPDPPELP